MGNSFVLKDGAGKPGGYLVQEMREICCRASGLTQRAKAVLLFADGTTEERMLEDGAEARWPSEGRRLCGGWICAQDKLLMATGKEARAALMRITLKRNAEQNRSEPACKNEDLQPGTAETKAKPSAQHDSECIWPQRRWPPPPCWPQAVYTQGRWCDPEK